MKGDGLVRKVTDCRLDEQEFWLPASPAIVTEDSFPVGKRQGRKFNQSPPSNTGVYNAWASLHPIHLHGFVLRQGKVKVVPVLN
jgi:hypothetical protein